MSFAGSCEKRILGSKASEYQGPEMVGTLRVYVPKKSERPLCLSGLRACTGGVEAVEAKGGMFKGILSWAFYATVRTLSFVLCDLRSYGRILSRRITHFNSSLKGSF